MSEHKEADTHVLKPLTSFIVAAVLLVLLSLLAFAFLLITTGTREEEKVSETESTNRTG